MQITSKELALLQDQMEAEYHANRKSSIYAQTMNDPNLKSLASTLAQHHRTRFDALYNFLNGMQ